MGTYEIRKARQFAAATYVTFLCCKLTLCGLQIVATSPIQNKLLHHNYVRAMKNVTESYVKIIPR